MATVPALVGSRRFEPRVRGRHRGLWSGAQDRWSLSVQIFSLILLVLAITVAPIWVLAVRSATDTARAEAVARAEAAAVALAGSPWLVEAAGSPDPPAVLREPIERIRAADNLLFIIVISPDGIRWTHPTGERVGGAYNGSWLPAREGGTVVEDFTGTLGPSVRVVVPARDGTGQVVALVSVAVAMASVNQLAFDRAAQVIPFAAGALAVGLLGSWAIARRLHRQTRGLGSVGLRRLHTYYEAVLHSLRAGLVMAGKDGTVMLINDDARDLIGMPEIEPGQRVEDLWLDPELMELMTSDRECYGEQFVEDGRVLVVTRERAVFDGEDLGWVTTLRDRTELVRLTGELDSLRSFSEMLRSRAHEADNRMHTVIMLIEMGRGQDAIAYATATVAGNRAQIEAVTRAVQDEPLAALLLGKSAQAHEHGVELLLAEDLDVPNTGDRGPDVLVIVGNLVDNAIDAVVGLPGERWVRVAGRVDNAAGGVRNDLVPTLVLEISDSGVGVDPADLDRIFTRGWSTKPAEDDARPHGRGLGLSLVSGAVRRLAGSIDVRQNPSRFEVRIPLPPRDLEK
ncbi:MAG: ATP-binding protein [Micropruina sp.]|uniref:sensor histidine kinase n=1 Tax=Micropruina sp. TaxID=2737536 RepID=UPI0039E30CB2